MVHNETPVTVIIPTYNNSEYLQPCLQSMLSRMGTEGLYRIIVVNNGYKSSCDWIQNEHVTVIQSNGRNLGWEGGLKEGLKHTTSPYIVFANDDIFIPPASQDWIGNMLQHFRNPSIGAVGPSSNTVLGMQSIWVNSPYNLFFTRFLIGYCMMVARHALDEVGGIDDSVPGGDDLDLSIKLRQKGYRLLVDKGIFVFHHGFKTGTRIQGDHTKTDGWNSWEMLQKTNTFLIKRYGIKEWYNTAVAGITELDVELDVATIEDAEGNFIRDNIKDGLSIVDLGCGHNKTVEKSIGVDMIPKGEKIISLKDAVSVADVVADVSKKMPFKDGEFDVVISRHILEHCIDPIATLREWRRITKDGGRLFIAVPDHTKNNTVPMNKEHVHAFTPDNIKTFAEASGLQVEQIHDPENGVSFVAVLTK